MFISRNLCHYFEFKCLLHIADYLSSQDCKEKLRFLFFFGSCYVKLYLAVNLHQAVSPPFPVVQVRLYLLSKFSTETYPTAHYVLFSCWRKGNRIENWKLKKKLIPDLVWKQGTYISISWGYERFSRLTRFFVLSIWGNVTNLAKKRGKN